MPPEYTLPQIDTSRHAQPTSKSSPKASRDLDPPASLLTVWLTSNAREWAAIRIACLLFTLACFAGLLITSMAPQSRGADPAWWAGFWVSSGAKAVIVAAVARSFQLFALAKASTIAGADRGDA
jgi:hypothetical protein